MAIVAPGGQRTELTVDANGWLPSSRTPGAIPTATYTANGLMETFTDARGGVHSLRFRRQRPAHARRGDDGGVTRLARVAIAGGYRVTRTSEPGLEQVYEARGRPEGGTVLRSIDAAGATTQVISRPDGTQTATYPDG